MTHFDFLMTEFSVTFFICIQLALAASPIVFGGLISVILCDEIPEFELQTTFSVVYFLYTLWICRPRYLYRAVIGKEGGQVTINGFTRQLIIPRPVLAVIYVLPVVVSFAMQIALHRNVLASQRHRIIGVFVSILLPTILMLYAYLKHEDQIDYLESTSPKSFQPDSSHPNYMNLKQQQTNLKQVKYLASLSMYTLIGFLGLFLTEHPYFDEIKYYSGLDEKIANILLFCLVAIMLLLTILKQKIINYQVAKYSMVAIKSKDVMGFDVDEEDRFILSSSSSSSSSAGLSNRKAGDNLMLMTRLAFNISLAFAVGLLGLFLHTPSSIIPINVIAAATLSELHFFGPFAFVQQLLLILIACLSTSISIIVFAKGTIYYLVYSFHSYFFESFDLPDFSHGIASFVAFAAILPVFISPLSDLQTKYRQMELLPLSAKRTLSLGQISDGIEWSDIESVLKKVNLFGIGCVSLSIISAFLELTMVEQVSLCCCCFSCGESALTMSICCLFCLIGLDRHGNNCTRSVSIILYVYFHCAIDFNDLFHL